MKLQIIESGYRMVNRVIIVINVLVFLVLELLGDTNDAVFMFAHGAMFPAAVTQSQEWYRLFTCMFIHFGINHIGNNMFILFFLGDSLERAVGWWRYLLIYLLSGLGGSILSCWIMLTTGDYAVSGGASGAVFGVIGALIYVVIRNRGRLEDLTTKRLVFMAALSLYHGFTSVGVDNAAHLGGIVSGFILAVLLYHKKMGKVRLPER